MTEFQYKDEYRYLTNICLNLTDACNLACKYCFVEQHPHFMTYDTAKAAVDWLAQNLATKKEKHYCKSKEKVLLTYFGGEPTLMWDEIIKPLTIYIHDTYPNDFGLSITTNGTLLNPERIEFMRQYGIHPLLSIDGAETTQNNNRPCQNGQHSFDLVSKNIPYILAAFPQTTFRATITPDTAQYLFENYCFAESVGFKSVYFTPNNREKWTDEEYQTLANQFNLIYNYRLNQFRNNQMPINASFINDSFINLLRRDMLVLKGITDCPHIHHTVRRCGLGTGMGAIAYDGSIYGCQEQPSKDEKNIFLIGNIFEGGINEQRHMELLQTYWTASTHQCELPEVCANCLLKPVCTQFACPSTCWDLFKDFNTISYTHCIWLNMLTEFAASTLQILVKENNLLFEEYLDKNCKYNTYWRKEENN